MEGSGTAEVEEGKREAKGSGDADATRVASRVNDKKFSEQNCEPPGWLQFTYCGPISATLIVELE